MKITRSKTIEKYEIPTKTSSIPVLWYYSTLNDERIKALEKRYAYTSWLHKFRGLNTSNSPQEDEEYLKEQERKYPNQFFHGLRREVELKKRYACNSQLIHASQKLIGDLLSSAHPEKVEEEARAIDCALKNYIGSLNNKLKAGEILSAIAYLPFFLLGRYFNCLDNIDNFFDRLDEGSADGRIAPERDRGLNIFWLLSMFVGLILAPVFSLISPGL